MDSALRYIVPLSLCLVMLSLAYGDERSLYESRMNDKVYDNMLSEASNGEQYRRDTKKYIPKDYGALLKAHARSMKLLDSTYRKSMADADRMIENRRDMRERFARPRGGRELLKDYAAFQQKRMALRPRGGKRGCDDEAGFRPRGGKRECGETPE